MRKLAVTLIAGAAMIGVAAPAMAQNYGWNNNNRHDQRHDRLEDRHDDNHDRLDDEHDAAHDEGLNRWEHNDVHRDLDYQHARADYKLQRKHERQHRRDQWRRYNQQRGYGYQLRGFNFNFGW